MTEDTQVTQDMPTLPPKKKRHWIGWTLLSVLALIVLGIVLGSLGHRGTPVATPQPSASTSAATAPKGQPAIPAASAPAAVAHPSGTFQGNCDYTLGDNPAGSPSTAVATGDILVVNTGNIGTKDKLTITWPQEGFSPLSSTKTVKVAAGQQLDVQFNHPMTSDEVDNLQNYQTNHTDTGCTYQGAMISTFGKAS